MLLLVGCSAPQRSASMIANGAQNRQPNLALGPSGEHAWLATRIAPRSDWPAVRTGYRIDEVTFYNTIIYDEESYYDRYGSMHHGTETIQTGVWLR